MKCDFCEKNEADAHVCLECVDEIKRRDEEIVALRLENAGLWNVIEKIRKTACESGD